MQIKKLMLQFPLLLCAVLLVTTGPTAVFAGSDSSGQTTARQSEPVAKGKVLGMSNKARTITIDDKKLGNVMIKFNDATEGLEFAKKGEAAIVKFKMVGDDRVATVVKPKLAKLPKGVSEIKPDELAKLMASGTDYLLVDSRPAKRYASGHITTAVSAPVAKLEKEFATILPMDNKDKLLLFYCGGPT